MFEFHFSKDITQHAVDAEIAKCRPGAFGEDERISALKTIFSLLDYTTLEGTDSHMRVRELCGNALSFGKLGLPLPAAVCIYPPFIRTSVQVLKGSGIRVATTAAGFPSGQTSINVKLAEVDYCVSEGADEIDVVISRGTFLEGDYETVFEELQAIRAHCRDRHLKVILETGELGSVENIARAGEIAITAGADFIKTSTGKVQPAATPQAMAAMLLLIRNHFRSTGLKTGIKPAGGISEPDQALLYYQLVNNILGSEWLNPGLFRIGASRLAANIIKLLT
jgi:deoxyribose-phosphate aldolase